MASGLAVVAYDYAAARSSTSRTGVNGFTVPSTTPGPLWPPRFPPRSATYPRWGRRSAGLGEKVRWKKVVKRFENQLEGSSPRRVDPVPVPAV